MGRSPCCEKAHTNKGAWTKEEDQRLIDYIRLHGEGCWRSLPKAAGLLRCGKSCRLRWINYLRPDLKRGNFTEEEDELIIKLHSLLGNKWSLIAGRLPGRTDNEIKNYWNTHIKRKLVSRGLDPQTHRPLKETAAATTNGAAGSRLNLRNSSPPALPVSEINLLEKSNSHTKSTFIVPKTEAINEENNCTSSGTTTEEDHQQSYQREPNLELSIGLVPFKSESTRASSVNSAESTLQRFPKEIFQTVQSPAATVAQAVCLCCQLGNQNGELCRNCEANRFFRFQMPL
ncbi:hypothetical protein UlMin_035554 [Ulmus minor]